MRGKPQPTDGPALDQAAMRVRRLAQLDITYRGDFDLLVEVHDIVTPLASRVSREKKSAACRAEIDAMAAAVHSLVVAVARLVARADARRAVRHIGIEHRGRAIAMLCDLAERPSPPVITPQGWAEELCAYVGPYSGPLSDLLSRAAAPGSRRGLPSVSEYLVEALRVVDAAASTLNAALSSARLAADARQSAEKATSRTDLAAATRAELTAQLADLGVVTS